MPLRPVKDSGAKMDIEGAALYVFSHSVSLPAATCQLQDRGRRETGAGVG